MRCSFELRSIDRRPRRVATAEIESGQALSLALLLLLTLCEERGRPSLWWHVSPSKYKLPEKFRKARERARRLGSKRHTCPRENRTAVGPRGAMHLAAAAATFSVTQVFLDCLFTQTGRKSLTFFTKEAKNRSKRMSESCTASRRKVYTLI